ncbi:uncharacterized protein LOC117182742 [Belonocnema kinseyi]|uniref:uncharacterized protein LOC117182742 n=1 Tax=Belonocnema kinseyi TaxID=2817044 RepID=UPI00143DA964|nr:uncharacterized protein LOC117182742 [Belonocnema kinseyi]
MQSFNKIDVVKVIIIALFSLRYTSSLNHGLSHNNAALSRTKRYLVFSPTSDLAITKVQLIFGLGLPMEVDVSTIIGYVMKCNYALPSNTSYLTNPYIRHARSMKYDGKILENFPSASHEKDRNAVAGETMTRYEIYKMVESIIDTFQSGKACLLKAICESAGTSLSGEADIFAQILHAFLTPSTTFENYKDSTDQEYHAAEIIGRKESNQCTNLFPECENSILDYFTEVL